MTPSASGPDDLFDLSGRRAVVTGASRGIGRAIALAYVRRGAHVVGIARGEEGLDHACELAAGAAGTFTPYAADLGRSESANARVAGAADILGGIDILVNNADADHDSSIEATELATYQLVLDVNLRSCWLLMRAASTFLADGGGKVINVASTLGLVAMRNDSAYVAAKHGLVGVTRAIGLEWADKGVQVNAICPGYVETAMLPDPGANEAAAEYIRRTIPMGRWAQPEEMVGAAIYLASAASSYMTGQVLVVDGGFTAK